MGSRFMDSGQHAERQSPGILWSFCKFLIAILLVLGLSVLLRTFVFQAYEIPSGSMETTIMTGDMVFAEKVSYHFREVEQGDIVTFDDPLTSNRTLIKRVIAVAGQTVDINDEDGLVYVDGEALEESYTTGATYTLESSVTYPYTVPEGCVWVMGDNRENSQDSRYFGAIEVSTVSARAVFVYWPLSEIKMLE